MTGQSVMSLVKGQMTGVRCLAGTEIFITTAPWSYQPLIEWVLEAPSSR